jgi:hypothetical protein
MRVVTSRVVLLMHMNYFALFAIEMALFVLLPLAGSLNPVTTFHAGMFVLLSLLCALVSAALYQIHTLLSDGYRLLHNEHSFVFLSSLP